MSLVKANIKKYFSNLIEILWKPELGILPGQLAYFFVLSIIPMITILFFVAHQLNISYDTITTFVKHSFSQDIAQVINPMIEGHVFDFKLFVFLVIAFFIATNGAHSIILTSNMIFNVPNSPFIKRRIKSVILTIILLFLMVFILLVPVFGQQILSVLSYLEADGNIVHVGQQILPILKWPITIFVTFFIIKTIYTIAPDAQIPSKFVNKGSLFTTILWVIATFIYSYYVTHIAQYDLFYGSLSNLVILMLWFYLMAYIFVVGMAIDNRNLEEYKERTKKIELDEIREAQKELEKHKSNI